MLSEQYFCGMSESLPSGTAVTNTLTSYKSLKQGYAPVYPSSSHAALQDQYEVKVTLSLPNTLFGPAYLKQNTGVWKWHSCRQLWNGPGNFILPGLQWALKFQNSLLHFLLYSTSTSGTISPFRSWTSLNTHHRANSFQRFSELFSSWWPLISKPASHKESKLQAASHRPYFEHHWHVGSKRKGTC